MKEAYRQYFLRAPNTFHLWSYETSLYSHKAPRLALSPMMIHWNNPVNCCRLRTRPSSGHNLNHNIRRIIFTEMMYLYAYSSCTYSKVSLSQGFRCTNIVTHLRVPEVPLFHRPSIHLAKQVASVWLHHGFALTFRQYRLYNRSFRLFGKEDVHRKD